MKRLILALSLVFTGCASTKISKPKMFLGWEHHGCGDFDEGSLDFEIKISPTETVKFDSERNSEGKVSATYCPTEDSYCEKGEGEYSYISNDKINIDLTFRDKRIRGTVLLALGSSMQCG